MVLKENTLTPGLSYSFELSIASEEREGRAKIHIFVEMPPSIISFASSRNCSHGKLEKIAFESFMHKFEDLTIVAAGGTAPFRYYVDMREEKSGRILYLRSSPSESSFLRSMLLPFGEGLLFTATVYDSQGVSNSWEMNCEGHLAAQLQSMDECPSYSKEIQEYMNANPFLNSFEEKQYILQSSQVALFLLRNAEESECSEKLGLEVLDALCNQFSTKADLCKDDLMVWNLLHLFLSFSFFPIVCVGTGFCFGTMDKSNGRVSRVFFGRYARQMAFFSQCNVGSLRHL